jgi:hypothetical protein
MSRGKSAGAEHPAGDDDMGTLDPDEAPTLEDVLTNLDEADTELDEAREQVRQLVDDSTPDPTPGRWIIRDDTLGQFVGGVVTKKPTKAELTALGKRFPGHVFRVVSL